MRARDTWSSRGCVDLLQQGPEDALSGLQVKEVDPGHADVRLDQRKRMEPRRLEPRPGHPEEVAPASRHRAAQSVEHEAPERCQEALTRPGRSATNRVERDVDPAGAEQGRDIRFPVGQ